MKSVSEILGGAGGGTPKFAQGGGNDKSKKEDSIKKMNINNLHEILVQNISQNGKIINMPNDRFKFEK